MRYQIVYVKYLILYVKTLGFWPAAALLDLEALEVRLVLDNLDETHCVEFFSLLLY